MEWQDWFVIGAGLIMLAGLGFGLWVHYKNVMPTASEILDGMKSADGKIHIVGLLLARSQLQALDSLNVRYPKNRLIPEGDYFRLPLTESELEDFARDTHAVARDRIARAARAKKPMLTGATLALGQVAAIAQHELLCVQRAREATENVPSGNSVAPIEPLH